MLLRRRRAYCTRSRRTYGTRDGRFVKQFLQLDNLHEAISPASAVRALDLFRQQWKTHRRKYEISSVSRLANGLNFFYIASDEGASVFNSRTALLPLDAVLREIGRDSNLNLGINLI